METEPQSRPNGEKEEDPIILSELSGEVEDADDEERQMIKSKLARRVKVYFLEGEDWLDNGTGYCMGEVDKKTNKPYFIVRSELDSDNIILKSYLEGTIQYQRQQETLIVWTDLSGKDLALSFQENEGCADLCDFIVKVQQKNLSPTISLYYVLSTMQDASEGPREITELITGPITYPDESPTCDNLQNILEVINQGSNSHYTRSKISEFLLQQNYFEKLLNIFNQAEANHDIHSLHLLSDITKVILLYNEPDVLEELVRTEKNATGLAGILEYDRDFPNFKACHREYLSDKSKFKTVVPIPHLETSINSDMSIFRKDFVLNYLKDVVLARSMDEQILGTLSSFIYSNQMEIISFMTDSNASDHFFSRLFLLYDLKSKSDVQKKRDGVRMLHQYVLVAKNHQANQRPQFFIALVKSGLFKMIEFALRDTDSDTRVGGTELLVSIIEQDVSLVNTATRGEYVDELECPMPGTNLLETKEPCDLTTENAGKPLKMKLVSDMSTTVVLCQLILKDKNPGLKIQAYEALKMLLSSLCEESGEGNILDNGSGQCFPPDSELGVKQYLEAFYKEVAPMLFKDFIDLLSEDTKKQEIAISKMMDDPILYQHLCDLLSFCLREHHPSLYKPFLFNDNVMRGVAKVLELNFKVILKLGALRCLKSVLLLNDYALTQYIIHNDLLHSFFVFFKSVSSANNLANSLCIDLLETIIQRFKGKNYRQLALYIHKTERHFVLHEIDYVSTGRDLIRLAEENIEINKDATATSIDADEDNISHHNDLSSPIQTEKENFVSHTNNVLNVGPTNIFQDIQEEFSENNKRHHDQLLTDLEESEPSQNVSENSSNGVSRKKKGQLSFEKSPQLETTASV